MIRLDLDGWAEVADVLAATGLPWPRAAVLADAQWWTTQLELPSRRELASRWGWSERQAQAIQRDIVTRRQSGRIDPEGEGAIHREVGLAPQSGRIDPARSASQPAAEPNQDKPRVPALVPLPAPERSPPRGAIHREVGERRQFGRIDPARNPPYLDVSDVRLTTYVAREAPSPADVERLLEAQTKSGEPCPPSRKDRAILEASLAKGRSVEWHEGLMSAAEARGVYLRTWGNLLSERMGWLLEDLPVEDRAGEELTDEELHRRRLMWLGLGEQDAAALRLVTRD